MATGAVGRPTPDLTAPGARPDRRRATRTSEGSYLGGVAGGLALHLGVDVTGVRVFFVVTGLLGFGVLFYAGLWLVLPMAPAPETSAAPGLAAATRHGMRPTRPVALRDAGPLVAMGVLALGVAGLLDLVSGHLFFVWWALALVGIVVLWRQADDAQRERWSDGPGSLDLTRVVLGDGGRAAWARLATGIGLLVAALVVFAAQAGPVSVARDVVLAGVLGMVGLALTIGPWLVRLISDLAAERAARVRSQERADVAAHLHDSVLQTLALIQRNADDPGQVARLARAQERDLRQWLYDEPAALTSLAAALRTAAAEVEDTHGVPVEVVTVGDTVADESLQPLVLAAREAMVNAARHSGAPKVDVYAEVADRAVEVFVRDRGRGFTLDAVPDDRLGLRNSVVDRMVRHAGSADVRSVIGEGTEIRLRMPLISERTAP